MPEQNPFFEGSFAPVREEITAFDLPVTGTLPPELNGCYLRNGPNPMGLEDPGARWGDGHWFLGSGMVHGVRLRDGRAEWYRNRWVRSRQAASALGEKWPGGPVHDDADFAANTHIIRHAGRVLATVEAGPLPCQLTGELETVGPYDVDGKLPGATPRTPNWTGAPGNCTPSPTTGPGTTFSTSSSTRPARSAAPRTSRLRTAR